MAKGSSKKKPLRTPVEEYISTPINGELKINLGDEVLCLTFQLWTEPESKEKNNG